MQIDLGGGRVVPLARLRGTVRPLIFAGSRGYVNKCLREVERFKPDLTERGISRAHPRRWQVPVFTPIFWYILRIELPNPASPVLLCFYGSSG
jgi:hypothetical protein